MGLGAEGGRGMQAAHMRRALSKSSFLQSWLLWFVGSWAGPQEEGYTLDLREEFQASGGWLSVHAEG